LPRRPGPPVEQLARFGPRPGGVANACGARGHVVDGVHVERASSSGRPCPCRASGRSACQVLAVDRARDRRRGSRSQRAPEEPSSSATRGPRSATSSPGAMSRLRPLSALVGPKERRRPDRRTDAPARSAGSGALNRPSPGSRAPSPRLLPKPSPRLASVERCDQQQEQPGADQREQRHGVETWRRLARS